MADIGQAFVIVLIIVVAIVIGFCCHFASLKRRDQERAANLRASQQAAGPTANHNESTGPVYLFGLQGATGTSNSTGAAGGESHSAEDRAEASVPTSPDAIADCGPPSYRCLAASDELPPPSYEEAIRASTEDIAGT